MEVMYVMRKGEYIFCEPRLYLINMKYEEYFENATQAWPVSFIILSHLQVRQC